MDDLSTTRYSDMQLIKRSFFAMRNGIITDTLRKAGSPYHIIFGVNLPQLREIAGMFTPSLQMAQRLWLDSRTRESMLLAPWMVPGRSLSFDQALEWLQTPVSAEAVDVLAMACLRGASYAPVLAEQLAKSADPLQRYAALRITLNNLGPDTASTARSLSASLSDDPSAQVRALASQIADELDWLAE